MELEKVLKGIMAYIDRNILPGMNDLQEFGYIALCETLNADMTPVKKLLEQNIFARMLLSADKEGKIDIERAAGSARKAIQKKGKISFKVPGYGSFTMSAEDVDILFRTIMEG